MLELLLWAVEAYSQPQVQGSLYSNDALPLADQNSFPPVCIVESQVSLLSGHWLAMHKCLEAKEKKKAKNFLAKFWSSDSDVHYDQKAHSDHSQWKLQESKVT